MVLLRLINPTNTRLPKRAKYPLGILIIALLTASCGQKGPLRMPEHKQRVTEQSQNKNIVTTPAQQAGNHTKAHVSLNATQIENSF